MKVGSLFTGIGGIDLGLEAAGMEVVWQSEIDEYCLKTLNKHWPNVPKYGDIYKMSGDELESVDIICGGFPCQPFSVAGKMQGKTDDRYLWPEMLRLIRELRPRWVLGENVANIVKMALDTVLSDLESEGYTTRTFIIPASAVGAPHRRDRVWIVAHSGCSLRQGELYRGSDEKQDRKGNANQTERPSEALADSNSKWELQSEGTIKDFRGRACNSSKRPTEPRLGRVFDGVSRRLDGHLGWPAPLGAEQHEWEPPRTTKGMPNRAARLKALGNAVVPQVVEMIGRAIIEAEKEAVAGGS